MMARCRTIKPGFMTNERLPELGPHAHLLYACLWMVADREGRLEDRPKKIKAECLPHYKVNIEKLLDLLASGDDPFIVRYQVNAKRFIQIVTWNEHQSPHHTEKESSIPPWNNGEVTGASPPTSEIPTTSNQQPVISNQESVTSNQQPEGDARGRKRFTPPTVEEVAAYCRERRNKINPNRFVSFYESKGWKVGKNPMVDWKASVRHWEQDSPESDPRGTIAAAKEYLDGN